ncbi:Intersectin-1 [Drechslerella dactyloides]|uniref:Intersectin-1 n=1 Tax=Drechslerella dactyloides TaxID=74499 RepID=A0AAD6IXZ7_DREDA|nr:Intersectin-1 [Drechslerella dactyloides]
MSALDLSQEGPAINRSVKSITTASAPSGKSPTHAHWVLLYVQAPLRNAFSQGPPKPSVLKVQSTGEGEIEELIEEFNDGRVQFALAKVKDPNTQLGKNIFFAWCGEGVPEHVKGSYGSYQSAVAKLFEGYHVQISARSTDTLNVDEIMRKVATASGSAYSAHTPSAGSSKPAAPPKPAWKPGTAYTPTRQYGTPAAPRGRPTAPKADVDADGWGADAPQVSRSKLENVQSAYQPTKVNMKEIMSQPSATTSGGFEKPDPVRGAYQPIGKVDIAAIRAQGDKRFDSRPEVIKGAYQPVGKVDIAAIRAAAQPPRDQPQPSEEGPSRSLADRSAAFNKPTPPPSSGRITSLPKPKPAKAFGTPAVFGTKPNLPSEYGTGPAGIPAAAPVGAASKDFASSGGKTPAQIWQEKKNRERGMSGSAEPAPPAASSWGAARAAEPEPSPPAPATAEPEEAEPQSGGVSALRDRFKGMPVPSMGGPPPMPMATKPTPAAYDEPEEEEEPPQPAARFVPPPPAAVQPQRSPTPSPPRSPARIAMPVARSSAPAEPPAVPHASRPRSPSPEPAPIAPAVAAGVGLAAVGAGVGFAAAAAAASSGVQLTGRRARIIYDYEKAEDNEIDLVEGEVVGMIEMVDDDWWQGTNEKGDTGLFPSNYVEPIEDDEEEEESPAARPPPAPPVAEPEPEMHAAAAGGGQTATAIYDYEAAEENELAFPEGATITDIEFPDEDWWFGHYNGAQGLFPSNYVELNH